MRFSTQLRGAWKISPGNTVKPTGSQTDGGVWPTARAPAWAASQYDRAADTRCPSASTNYVVDDMVASETTRRPSVDRGMGACRAIASVTEAP